MHTEHVADYFAAQSAVTEHQKIRRARKFDGKFCACPVVIPVAEI